MTVSRTTAEPLWDLVEESLEEAAFLWKRWEADIVSLTRNLDEVYSWTEDRLQGALDGVRAAGAAITHVAGSAIGAEDPALVTVGAHLLAARSPVDARNALVAAVGEAQGPRLWSMVRGIEVARLDGTFAAVTAALSGRGPEHGAALCRLKAFRRSAPGREVPQAFESNIPSLQIEALRAARYASDGSFGKYLAAGLRSADPTVRRVAIECGVRNRAPEAWDVAVRLAHERNPEAAPLLPLLAMLGSSDQHQIVVSALREPALQQAGLYALGHIGTPEAVEICLSGMRDPKLARSAGEAYAAITGANLARDNLSAPEPEEPASPPPLTTDPLDANLVPAQQDLWPLPDVEAVRRHWASQKSRYQAGVRHLSGRPVNLSVLIGAIESGPMLRRADLIAEAEVRTAGRYDVEPRAFADVQRRMMSAGRGASPADGAH